MILFYGGVQGLTLMKDFNDFTALTPKQVQGQSFWFQYSFNVEGVEGRTFAIASSKKFKQLKKSDADVVYFEKNGN